MLYESNMRLAHAQNYIFPLVSCFNSSRYWNLGNHPKVKYQNYSNWSVLLYLITLSLYRLLPAIFIKLFHWRLTFTISFLGNYYIFPFIFLLFIYNFRNHAYFLLFFQSSSKKINFFKKWVWDKKRKFKQILSVDSVFKVHLLLFFDRLFPLSFWLILPLRLLL